VQRKHRLATATPAAMCSLSLCKSAQPVCGMETSPPEWRKGCQYRSRSPTFNQPAKSMGFTEERVDLYPKEHAQRSGTGRNPCHGSGAGRALALRGKQAYPCRLSAHSGLGARFSFCVAGTPLGADAVLLH